MSPGETSARIAIVGGGAMGSVFAGLFASAGHEVTIVSRPGAHLEAIRKVGLRVEGASGDRTVNVRALGAPPEETFDLIILAVKATQVEAAVAGIAPMLGASTPLMAIQNGLGAVDIISRSVHPDRIAVGIAAAFGASVVAPGHVHHAGMGLIQIGAVLGLPADRVDWIADLWRSAGFKAEATKNIVSMQWEKLICNASFSAPCAITGLTVGGALSDPWLGPVCIAAGKEAWNIARASGVTLGVTDPEAHIRAFAERVSAAKPSLLQDLEAGRPSEIDFINGAIPREASRVGAIAPVNETLTALVKALEAKHAR
ncbi:MAG: 2-dehydropantoate 2-reductase [Alphaproteobacteria bacterium HGW-Alphaproteobacteria-18]|nr:MAG: 2-dehydropantoate 2-reductase [Alphaproteobacteria bacterium HGW-Alphaproteobacteria-18]